MKQDHADTFLSIANLLINMPWQTRRRILAALNVFFAPEYDPRPEDVFMGYADKTIGETIALKDARLCVYWSADITRCRFAGTR